MDHRLVGQAGPSSVSGGGCVSAISVQPLAQGMDSAGAQGACDGCVGSVPPGSLVPGHGPCLGCGEREECGGSAPQAAPSSSACCVPAGVQARGRGRGRPAFLEEPGICIAMGSSSEA